MWMLQENRFIYIIRKSWTLNISRFQNFCQLVKFCKQKLPEIISNLQITDRGEDDEKLQVRIVRLRTFSALPEAVTSQTEVIIEFSFCGSKLVGMERVNFIHDLGALVLKILFLFSYYRQLYTPVLQIWRK